MKSLKILIIFLSIMSLLGSARPAQAANNQSIVVQLDIDGVINPFSSRYLKRGLDLAQRSGAELVLVTLDTPGGLESSMREMVQAILDSTVPVVMYVTPAGARATSAGLFILLASDVAAMTPASHVGAATPVAMSSEMDEMMSEKSISDASALVRGLAESRGRNVEWAESAVRESLSLTAREAVDENVIEILANDIDDLLEQLDGMIVRGEKLDLSATIVQKEGMNWIERFYHVITEPNIAYLLLSLGTLFLLVELSDPGLSVAGIGAVLSFIIGFMALGSLPVNWAAVGLLVISVILFVVALLTDTEVVVTIVGLIPFILGSLLLFRPFRPESPIIPEVRVNIWLIIFMALFIVFFSLIILRAILTALKRKPQMGAQRFVGEKAITLTDLSPDGKVKIQHQNWSATSIGGNVQKGQEVLVVSVSGVRLMVSPVDESG
ncbi:MAG TPA: nodulation protein NfeD [Brevefilum sp.]|nr:nodulation protein NfeD [Brevefilum sp.]HOR18375.1 nodulation protein NfeD [Brevefilum sp.]